ncbi:MULTISPECIES: hypothetical protein [unclassified Sphingobium]|uniref:hypothetical protein n=1 Tax=unclassified Sphingobium TaxID=2611147 RepID=UPI0035A5D7A8
MRTALLCATGFIALGTAHAEPVRLTPSLEARLRFEHVAQEGIALDADATTLRLRPGVIASAGNWSLLGESEGVLALGGDYFDGTNGRSRYPLIADPQNLELNRLQLRYAGKTATGTIGRQRLNLSDDRFVGTAPWRQSEQTYDAARLQWGRPGGLRADIAYSWSVRTVNGRNGKGARPQAIGGDNIFALLSYGGPALDVTAFAYLVDQDAPAVQGYRLSSQTYGLRATGRLPVGRDITLAYQASWARQSDWRRNPNDFAADYRLGEVSLTGARLGLTGGVETLGADRGVALTSVQTPLASHFRFNGWAGKFVTTPPDGLRDIYGSINWRRQGRTASVNAGATWHHFSSDRDRRSYGEEIDLIAGTSYRHCALSARCAHYEAKGFATDTDKLWVQMDWSL